MKNNYSKEILTKKAEFNLFLTSFYTDYQKIDDRNEIQKLLNKLICKHIDLLNFISNSIGHAHQENDFFYNPDLRKDFLSTSENYIKTSFIALDLIQSIINKHNLYPYQLDSKSYFTIQKMINTFSDVDDCTSFINEFQKRQIPTSGFKHKFKKMKHKYLRLQLLIGIPFMIAFFILAFMGESFTGQPFNGIQLIGLKALLALSVSIVGSSLIEGQVESKWSLSKGLTIRAFGWVAVFLFLYFLNPANPGDVY